MKITTEKMGGRIKQARLEKNLTQNELAKHLDRSKSSISQLEKGFINISAVDLYQLAQLLEKPIEYFYGSEKYGESLDSLLSKIQNADAKTIKQQSSFLESWLNLNDKMIKLGAHPNIDDDGAIPLIREVYDHLILHLINLRKLLNEGFQIKREFEEILGISDDNNPSPNNLN